MDVPAGEVKKTGGFNVVKNGSGMLETFNRDMKTMNIPAGKTGNAIGTFNASTKFGEAVLNTYKNASKIKGNFEDGDALGVAKNTTGLAAYGSKTAAGAIGLAKKVNSNIDNGGKYLNAFTKGGKIFSPAAKAVSLAQNVKEGNTTEAVLDGAKLAEEGAEALTKNNKSITAATGKKAGQLLAKGGSLIDEGVAISGKAATITGKTTVLAGKGVATAAKVSSKALPVVGVAISAATGGHAALGAAEARAAEKGEKLTAGDKVAITTAGAATGAAFSWGAVAAGTTAGAALGSVVPVVGTAVGGVIGGVAGAIGGAVFSDKIADLGGQAAKAIKDFFSW